MKTKNVFVAIGICVLMSGNQMLAQPEPDAVSGATLPVQDTLPSGMNSSGKKSFAERFTIGGYGEAVMTYNMYSDTPTRKTTRTAKATDVSTFRMLSSCSAMTSGKDGDSVWRSNSNTEGSKLP